MDPESQRAQTAAAELIVQLYGLVKALAMYDPNNDAVVRQVEAICASVERYYSEPGDRLTIQMLAEEFFVNGRLLRVDGALYDRASGLAAILPKYGFEEITIERGMTRAHLESFVVDMGLSVRAGSSRLAPGGYGAIRMARSSGHSVASFRFQPDKLAAWLYAGLLDLVDKLYEEFAAGRAPSLLPIKRTLQLIIDNMGSGHGGIYQALAAIRDPEKPVDVTRIRVATAINAIGFGVYLGLNHHNLMILSLGGLLGGLTNATDPDEAVRPLFRFPGLGDSAMSLTLALHDARAARQDLPAGIPGRILAVAEVYEELTAANTQRPALSPHMALEAIVEGMAGIDADTGRLFAEYKGTYPLGSPLKLKGGGIETMARDGIAVVIAHGTGPEGRSRPVVALLNSDGKLGEHIDLGQRREVVIERAPHPSDVGLNLATT